MLKIERVEIHGFKSFCDRTEVRFPHGITAVVGPNGCGKSNIGDAIHWVLGEQSPRHLRGARMEDVIFAGTEGRGPHGMAEVSLHLQATNGDLPGSDPSAIVTRRLFRSGDSEYILNGRRVRLRDVQEMLHGARVGATTYAVIEQGKVDAILSAKPRERRYLIEEAAGIIGYKQKRRLAELKLEATQANLLRIHDVVLEVRRQINSLKRQAARARRYSRLRDELRGIESRALAARARALEAEIARKREALDTVHAREAEAAAALARAEADLEAARASRRELEAEAGRKRDESHRLSREIDREEAVIGSESLREREANQDVARIEAEARELDRRLDEARRERSARIETLALLDTDLAGIETVLESLAGEEAGLRARCERISAQIEEGRSEQFSSSARLAESSNTVLHLDREMQRLAAQSARLREEKEAAELESSELAVRAEETRAEAQSSAEAGARARTEAEGARAAYRSAEDRIRAGTQSITGRREALARLDERVGALEDDDRRFAGFGSGARWVLTRGGANGTGPVRGVVADFLAVESEAEPAVEAYLGPLLGAIVVPSSESAITLVGDLQEARAGRALFVPETSSTDAPPSETLPSQLAAEPAVIGPLAAVASTTNGIGHALAKRLTGAVLARDLPSAVELGRRYPGRDFVTPAGEVVGRDGTIEGGRGPGEEDGPLAIRRRLEAARHERREAAETLSQEERALGALEAERGALFSALAGSERALAEAGESLALAREREGSLSAERARSAQRLDLLRQEISGHESEMTATREKLARAASDRETLQQSLAALESRLQAHREDLESARSGLRDVTEKLAGRREQREAVRERRAHVAAEGARLEIEAAGVENQIARGEERRLEAQTRAVGAGRAAAEARERLAGLLIARDASSRGLGMLEEGLREGGETEHRLEMAEREGRARLEAVREDRRQAEIEVAAGDSERRHLDERGRETLDETLENLLLRVPPEETLDPAALETETATLRSRLEAMGPVNLLAIDEFRQLEERHEFLSSQEKDLTGSIESLKDTIRKINRTSRDLFLEAFERVRANFNETFRLLFGGGRADIRLMEDEDPLECGLEINVQPPGKRLQSLSLLSGGERALSAIALLFAIFRYQPSPFCLLDEVDAALDESNVRRFTRMLKEFSGETQFIVITHNKRAMEAADTLYGVTMEEPGISKIVSMNLS